MLASGPIVWSETRQELCESLAYYRAYQTGSYVTGTLGRPPSSSLTKRQRQGAILKDSIPYGYLLAGWPSRRDACAHNARVIISHGGGKSQVHPSSAPSVDNKASLKQDQSATDSTIRALLHSSRHTLPIVLIAADSYALLPFKIPCAYAVLGWYLITDCWAERENSGGVDAFVRCKFRFEWIPAQGAPWWELARRHPHQAWDPRQRVETFTQAQLQLVDQMLLNHKTHAASSTTPNPMHHDQRQRILLGKIQIQTKRVSTVVSTPDADAPCDLSNAATCLACRFASPIVFDIGWMCLQPECLHFFLLPSAEQPREDGLGFSVGFLHPRGTALDHAFPAGRPPFCLIPSRPSSESMDQARGLWCPNCGRLSCREVIYQPRCAHCGHRVGNWKPLPTVPPPSLLRNPFDFSSGSHASGSDAKIFDPIISPSSGIQMSMRKEDGLLKYTFTFPAMFGDCCVHLVQADVEGGANETAADAIFSDFQTHSWPVDSTNQADAEPDGSRKRKRSPSATNGVEDEGEGLRVVPFRRHVLKSHAGGSGRMLTQQFTCNYGVAYKHVVAMGTWPLDSTSPPVILSTLDLLHARTRSIMAHANEFNGFNELYPVLYLDHQKMSFHDDGEPGLGPVVSSLSLGSTCRMKFRLKAKYAARFAQVEQRERVVLSLPLRHGSVVVQQGRDLQTFFEHSVSPDGFRIAVTARRIDVLQNDASGAVRGRAKHIVSTKTTQA